jgi:hypothetical protein
MTTAQPPHNPQPIIDAIKRDGVTMHSHRYFRLRRWLAFFVLALFSSVVIWHCSVLLFGFTHSGQWYLAGFGASGWQILFLSLPWLLIFIGLVFIFALFQLLIRSTGFYRLPTTTGLVIILGIAGLSAYAIVATPLHINLHRNVAAQMFPFLSSFYEHSADREPARVITGTVVQVNSNEFTIVDRRGGRLIVTTTAATDHRGGYQPRVGDAVGIIGDLENDRYQATSIQRLPNSFYCEIADNNDNVGGCH